MQITVTMQSNIFAVYCTVEYALSGCTQNFANNLLQVKQHQVSVFLSRQLDYYTVVCWHMMMQKNVFASHDSDLASYILLIPIEIFCDNDLVVTTHYLYIYTCILIRMHSIVLFLSYAGP